MRKLWQVIVAKFKQRLSMSDLHEATDEAFEIAARTLPDMFNALKKSEPETDFSRVWRKEFSRKLEIIAAEQTRKSQAAECRSLFLKTVELRALARTLISAKIPFVTRMFLVEDVTSDISAELVQSLAAREFVFRMVDETALMLLYKQQFNSTLSFDDFDHDLNNMYTVMAEFNLREGCHLLMSLNEEREEGWDKLYIEVFHPVFAEFEPIFRSYKENLCLLSPNKPDASAFYECNERGAKALEMYQ